MLPRHRDVMPIVLPPPGDIPFCAMSKPGVFFAYDSSPWVLGAVPLGLEMNKTNH